MMRYAGFWRRLVAIIIDGLVIGVILWVLSVIGLVGLPFAVAPEDIAAMQQVDPDNPAAAMAAYKDIMEMFSGVMLVFWVVTVVLNWLYYALLESSPAQATLGKMALGLVVTNLQGERISFLHATGRHFAKFISAVILLIGYLMAAFTEKKQALHDIIAGTLVLKKPERVFVPAPPAGRTGV
jgi:uncharacterized RDD family membrane protein YckC